MTTLEWLQSTTKTLEGKEITILEELAMLIGMNGGMQFKGWGVMTQGGPYGRLGVSMEEAHKLLYLSGVLDGFTKAEGAVHTTEVTQMIKDQIKKDAEARSAPKILGLDEQPINRT